MAAPGELGVGPQRVDDGDVAVEADDDEDHGGEVEAEGPEEREQLAGHVAGEPEPEETPADLERFEKGKVGVSICTSA